MTVIRRLRSWYGHRRNQRCINALLRGIHDRYAEHGMVFPKGGKS